MAIKSAITQVLFDTHSLVDEVTKIYTISDEEGTDVGIVIYREHIEEYSFLDSFTYYGNIKYESDAIKQTQKLVLDDLF